MLEDDLGRRALDLFLSNPPASFDQDLVNIMLTMTTVDCNTSDKACPYSGQISRLFHKLLELSSPKDKALEQLCSNLTSNLIRHDLMTSWLEKMIVTSEVEVEANRGLLMALSKFVVNSSGQEMAAKAFIDALVPIGTKVSCFKQSKM